MAKVRGNGITTGYATAGRADAPVVVLLHSLAADRSMWAPQIAALADRFRIVALDFRGHGESDAPGGEYTIDLLADDVLAALDALRIERFHLIGLSLGGMVAQCIAARKSERVQSLVLAATASALPGGIWAERIAQARQGGMASLADGTLERWLTAPFRQAKPNIAASIRAMIAATPVDGFAGCAAAIRDADLSPLLKRIAQPTLVLVGSEDRSTTVAMAERMRNGIAGSRLMVITGAAHLLNIEKVESFNEAVGGFLSASCGEPADTRPGPASRAS
jgi:3-oxoadipate enol-lactonase